MNNWNSYQNHNIQNHYSGRILPSHVKNSLEFLHPSCAAERTGLTSSAAQHSFVLMRKPKRNDAASDVGLWLLCPNLLFSFYFIFLSQVNWIEQFSVDYTYILPGGGISLVASRHIWIRNYLISSQIAKICLITNGTAMSHTCECIYECIYLETAWTYELVFDQWSLK